MAAQKKKKQKTTYYQVTPQATTEQQLRIQKMRDELNAPDPNDPHVFTRYKKITYPFVVLFPPYALYRIWCKKSEFNQREKYVQTAVCVLILFYFIAFRLNWFRKNFFQTLHNKQGESNYGYRKCSAACGSLP